MELVKFQVQPMLPARSGMEIKILLFIFFLVCFNIKLLHLVFSPKETREAACFLPCKIKSLHASVSIGVSNYRAQALWSESTGAWLS